MSIQLQYDNTSIDQNTQIVEIQRPDGKPDVLQQLNTTVIDSCGYKAMVGFIGYDRTRLHQYTTLGVQEILPTIKYFVDRVIRKR